MKLFLITVMCLFASAAASTAALAEIAVIVNPSNDSSLSTEDLNKLYLGKSKKFANGQTAIPLDRKEGTDIHKIFGAGRRQGRKPNEILLVTTDFHRQRCST